MAPEILAAVAATWPPVEVRRLGPWTLRRGDGGGSRVSAATLDGPGGEVSEAEAVMRGWGQTPLFMIRPGDEALDSRLADVGYDLRDPVVLLAAPSAALAPDVPDVRAIVCTAPLAVMAEIWRAGGIGPERLAVMLRVAGPRAFLLGRSADRPAASAFVAAFGEVATLHALEVAPFARRRGVGTALFRAAAAWALAEGAGTLALAVARANAEALALYYSRGMAEVATYHYRVARGYEVLGAGSSPQMPADR